MGTTSIEWSDATWMPVPGYDGYAVTSNGRIRGPSGRELRPMRAHRGHLYILTKRPGVPRKLFIHRAVLLAFVGAPPPGMEHTRHLNDISDDNRLSNLRWGSPAENRDDAMRNGRVPRGENAAAAKLSEADVLAIRDAYPGETLRALGKRYGVSHTAIRRAINGTKWGHI